MEPLVHFFCTGRPPSQNALQQLSVPPVPLCSRGRPRRAGHFLELLNRDAQLWPAKVRITHRLFALPGPAVTFNLPFDSPVCPQPRSSSLTNRCGYGGGGGGVRGYGLFLLIHNHSGDIFNSCWGQIWINRVNIAVDESTYDNRRRWLFLADSSSSFLLHQTHGLKPNSHLLTSVSY